VSHERKKVQARFRFSSLETSPFCVQRFGSIELGKGGNPGLGKSLGRKHLISGDLYITSSLCQGAGIVLEGEFI